MMYLDFVARHAETTVRDSDFARFFITRTFNSPSSPLNGVGYQLPQKNLVVGVEKLLDDGEDVLGVDRDTLSLVNPEQRRLRECM